MKAYLPFGESSDETLKEVLGSDTVLYTAPVLTSPKEIAREINHWRQHLYTIWLEPIRREEIIMRDDLIKREKEILNNLDQRAHSNKKLRFCITPYPTAPYVVVNASVSMTGEPTREA